MNTQHIAAVLSELYAPEDLARELLPELKATTGGADLDLPGGSGAYFALASALRRRGMIPDLATLVRCQRADHASLDRFERLVTAVTLRVGCRSFYLADDIEWDQHAPLRELREQLAAKIAGDLASSRLRVRARIRYLGDEIPEDATPATLGAGDGSELELVIVVEAAGGVASGKIVFRGAPPAQAQLVDDRLYAAGFRRR